MKKQLIILNENHIKYLINNTLNILLNEGRNADKAKTKTFEVIRKFFNNASWLDNVYDSPDANPNKLTVIEYIEHNLKEWLFHANTSDAIIRLEPIMMNIALSLGYEQGNEDSAKLNRLQLIMDYIIENYRNNDFPIQLNKLTLENTTYDSLNKMFGEIIDGIVTQNNAKANSRDENSTMNSDYDVIEVRDFKTAASYGKYSCSTSQLCYTKNESTWKQYTNNGRNRVYLILRKDWKEVPEEHGENTPYDDYGLSMIFLFINPDGEIAYSNTRWNHDTNGQGPSNVDKSFNKPYISDLLGVNFDSVFKPFNEEDYMRSFKEAKMRLERGDDLNDIFDEVWNVDNGCIIVKLNNKWSFIDKNGKLIGDGNLWFNNIYDFNNGFACVQRDDNKYSFIDENGKLIDNGNAWFDYVDDFENGFAVVRRDDNKWSLIDKNGKLIGNGELWFNNIDDFYNGFAKVQRDDDKWSLIDKNGELIGNGNLWFNRIYKYCNGFARVVRDDYKYSFIDTNYRLIGNGNAWFDYVDDFENGFAVVKRDDDKWSLIDKNGELIGNGNLWFKYVSNFYGDFAKVKYNDKWYYIDINGNFYDNKTKEPIPNPIQENKTVKRQVIKLTESDLHKIIENSIKRIIKHM